MAGYIIYSLNWGKFQQFVDRPSPAQLAAFGRLLSQSLPDPEEFEDDDPILSWPRDTARLTQLAAQRLALPDWYGDISSAGKDLWESVIFDACTGYEGLDLGFRMDSEGVYWDVIELALKHLGVVPYQVSEAALSGFGTRPYRYYPKPGGVLTREQYEQTEDRRAGLKALSGVLGQFVEDAKRGELDLDKVMEEFDKEAAAAEQQAETVQAFLSDRDLSGSDQEIEEWQPMHSMHTPDEVQKMLSELRSVSSAFEAVAPNVRLQYQDDLLPALQTIAREVRMLFVQVDT